MEPVRIPIRTDFSRIDQILDRCNFYIVEKNPTRGAVFERKMMVGTVRFELTTPWMSTKCSNQLSYAPEEGALFSLMTVGAARSLAILPVTPQ